MTESVATEPKWLSYDQLVTTQNDKIEIAKCIQNQYMHHLKNNFARNKNEDVILAMCIRDSWKWINEVGFDALRNNECLSNELKSIKSRYDIERSQWEEFCNELKNTNRIQTNENCELKNNVQNMKQLHDVMLNEYQIYKNENESLLHQLQNFQKQRNETENKMKEFQKQISNLTESINYLLKEKDSMIKQNNININQLNDEHKYTINEMEIIITNLLQEKQEFDRNQNNTCACYEKGETSISWNAFVNNENKKLIGEEMSNIYTNEICIYKNNLHKLFSKYKLIDESNTIFDLRLSLELIENVLKNSDRYKNEYMLANEQIEKLQYRLKHKKPPMRRVKIKRTKSMSKKKVIDPIDILSEICDDLCSLMKYLTIVQNKNQFEYCTNKINSLALWLQDLANINASPLLQNTANILYQLRNKMYKNANIYRFDHKKLHDIINKIKNKISDLYINTSSIVPQSPSISRRTTNQNNNTESLNDVINVNQTVPFIESLKFDDSFDKTPKAIIRYKSKKYRRKLSDFEWLSNILCSNGFRDIPKLQCLSSKNLKQTQYELNVFLKQCHGTKWIRQFEGYNKVFFAKTEKEWKRLKKKYEKKIFKFSV